MSVSVNSFANNLRFAGQYFDEETGLHYNYVRDYDPQTGRYVQSDPIGLNGGLKSYTCVGSNPINLTDFFGLMVPRGTGGGGLGPGMQGLGGGVCKPNGGKPNRSYAGQTPDCNPANFCAR